MKEQEQNMECRMSNIESKTKGSFSAIFPQIQHSTFNSVQDANLLIRLHSTQKGFTLIETIIYIAAFSMLSLAAMQATIVIMKSFYTLRLNQSVNVSATVALERMSREIRNAYDVDTLNSIFSTNPGRLVLMTKDDLGANTTVDFYVSGSNLSMRVGGVENGSLLTKMVTVPNLIFRPITTTNSKAVKVEMTLHDSRATSTQSTNFYDTIVLRGSVH